MTSATLIPNAPAVNVDTTHRVFVGLAVLIVVGMILTEGAGHSKDAATLIILVLVGVFLMEGMTHATQFSAFAQNNPYNPLPSGNPLVTA